jgi:ATP-binding protein involved in chromosome partitioning
MDITPLEIDRSAGTEVRILWSDRKETVFAARTLRLLCTCAHCVHEVTGERLLDPETVPEDIRADGISLVGRYAVSFDWSDGHSTGIYTFENLARIREAGSRAE